MTEDPHRLKRASRVILLLGGGISAIVAVSYGFALGLADPRHIGGARLVAQGAIALGVILVAVGVWRRRFKRSS